MITQDEYKKQEAELLAKTPVEFHAALSYAAYESGHSAGYEECLIHLGDLVDALAEPLRKFENRVRREEMAAYHEAKLWTM